MAERTCRCGAITVPPPSMAKMGIHAAKRGKKPHRERQPEPLRSIITVRSRKGLQPVVREEQDMHQDFPRAYDGLSALLGPEF